MRIGLGPFNNGIINVEILKKKSPAVDSCKAIFAFKMLPQNSTEPVTWFISNICIAVICCIPLAAPSLWCILSAVWPHLTHLTHGHLEESQVQTAWPSRVIGDWLVKNFDLSSSGWCKNWCLIDAFLGDVKHTSPSVMMCACDVWAHPDAGFPPLLLGPIL